MTEPVIYYQDDRLTLHHGAAIEVLQGMPDESVGCIFTSTPYFGLRKYGDDPREQGTEPTVPEFVAGLLAVFREARRVLAKDGTLWVNLGDTYSSKANARNTDAGRLGKGHARVPRDVQGQRNTTDVAPYKSLLLIPERFSIGMADMGWIARNRVTWVKTNGTPEPIKDRFTNKSEAMWLFTKSARYWFDLDAVREPHTGRPQRRHAKKADKVARPDGQSKQTWAYMTDRPEPAHDGHPLGRNPGDSWVIDDEDPAQFMDEVWRIPNQPFGHAHYAVMNPEVARRAIKAGCRPGATVLDPYSGAGTTGMVAAELGHPYVGIELYQEYLDLSLRTRLAQGALTLGA